MKTFDSIQILRMLAANLVVLSHMLVIERKYSGGFAVLPPWLDFTGRSGVHCFFVISGFIMGVIALRSRWRDFLWARLTRIYPIYWVYSALALAVLVAAPQIINTSVAVKPSIVKSFLLWPQDTLPLLAVGWSLIHEMYFYLVVAAVIGCGLNLRIAMVVWAAVIAAAFGAVSASPNPFDGPLAAIAFSPMTFEFILGVLVGTAIGNGVTRLASAATAAGTTALFAGAWWWTRTTTDGPPPTLIAEIAALGLPFVLIVYGLAASDAWHAQGWARLPVRLGDASYSIYLSHVFVLSAIGRFYASVVSHGWFTEGGFIAVCFVAANGWGLISYRWLERPLIRASRQLSADDSRPVPAASERHASR